MQILRLVIERVLLSLLTLLIVSLIIFFMLEILPGDVATRILGRDATPETLAALRAAPASRYPRARCAMRNGWAIW